MPNIHTGTIFDVGQNRTTGHSINNYLKWAGVDRFGNKEIDYDPEDYPVEDNLEVGTGEFDDYHKTMNTFRDFAMDMASKGIDITNPDYNNPQSVRAAKVANMLQSRIAQEASALKSGMQMKELLTKERLKDGRGIAQDPNAAPPGGMPDVTKTQDLDRLYNYGDWADRLSTFVKEVNDVNAKEFDTNPQAETANKQIQEANQKLGEYKQSMLQQGVPEQVVNDLIEGARGQLGEATYNPLAERLANSRIGAYDALKRKRNRAGKDDDDEASIRRRKETVFRVQNKDPDVLGVFEGMEIGGKRVKDAKYDTSGHNTKLVLTYDTDEAVLSDDGKYKEGVDQDIIEISEETGGGFARIWNLLNEVFKEEIDLDMIDQVPDPDYDKIRQEISGPQQKKQPQSSGNTPRSPF